MTILRTKISRTVIDVNRDPSGTSLYRGQAKTGFCPLTSFDGEPSYVAGREAYDADIQRRQIANGACLPRLYGRAGNSGAGKMAEPDYFLHTCFDCFENHYRKFFAMNRLNNARVIRAPHGSLLAAKSWQTEAPLRMVMNNLDPNEMVVRGELSAPVVIGRDHLDSGSVASPNCETESMLDGSDVVSDWSLLNAVLNCASGATWVSLHHGGGVGMGFSQHSGMVICADGTTEAAICLANVLWYDPANGLIRHPDAGYDVAGDCAREFGLDLPGILG